ncbi:MAG TPA: alpha/beta hydrolase [Chitinophagaceae bacterium]|jgi:pimeloyl-ACP methyl ester carboxylesterase|nr:alpha/beta hydrolase [Chitinophagaceae bacterium]
MKLLVITLLMLVAGICLLGQAVPPRWKTLPVVPALAPAADSGWIMVKGARLFYAVYNPHGGEPVLLLHGGFGNTAVWGFEVPLLATKHTVILMDSRGHGRSTMGSEPLSYAGLAEDALTLLDSLHIPKVSIVGWSDGGITGLVLAIYHPQRVNKLFTYGSNFNKSGEKHDPPDTALGAKFMKASRESYEKMSATPDGFAQLRKSLVAMYANEPNLDTNAIKKIKAPTVIGCGEYEQFYTREHFQLLRAMIPGARLVVIPAVSHGGPWQDPQSFHAAVAELLDHTQ